MKKTNTMKKSPYVKLMLLSLALMGFTFSAKAENETTDNTAAGATEIKINSGGDNPEATGNIGGRGTGGSGKDADYYKIKNDDDHEFIFVAYEISGLSGGPDSGQLRIYEGVDTTGTRIANKGTEKLSENGVSLLDDGSKIAIYTIEAKKGADYLICLEENTIDGTKDYELSVKGSSAKVEPNFKVVSKDGETYGITVTSPEDWKVSQPTGIE